MAQKDDRVIIIAYGHVPAEQARNYAPTVVLMHDDNTVIRPAA